MSDVTVFDVAKAFLTYDSMTHKKLQKLCYYSQAWHLALFGKPLFKGQFQAWVHGPVCPELYHNYKSYGWADIPKFEGTPLHSEITMGFVEVVFNTYGKYSGDDLETLTHNEKPWIIARADSKEWEPSYEYISEDIMREYYKGVYEKSQND